MRPYSGAIHSVRNHDGLTKSQHLDRTVKSARCKVLESLGIQQHAIMTKVELQPTDGLFPKPSVMVSLAMVR
jgi:hypothetical protein